MKFPWTRADGRTGSVESPGPAPAAQSCPTLAKALEKVLREDKPEILDLGPMCGATAVYLADMGARVSVGEFEPPATPDEGSAGPEAASGEETPPPPIRIDQPSGKFHLVLTWELIDFIAPERLAEFGGELQRVTADGGWVVLFSLPTPPAKGPEARRPPRYRVVSEQRLLREQSGGPPHRRYGHPTRDVERALSPLAIQGIHLQRNQMREFLAAKRRG